MKAQKSVAAILKYLFILLIILLSVGPFLWVFLSSFKMNTEVLNAASFFPKEFRISNYVKVFTMVPIGRLYLNSILVAVLATVLNLLILGMSGYVVARFNFKGRELIVMLISLAMLIPGAALLLPIYLTIKKMGLTDNILGLIIVYAGFGLPTSFYILSSYFMTIPKELEESSYLDGAGFVKTFSSIILPISKPGFATAAVIQFLGSWNEFQFAITLTTGIKSRTLPLTLYYFKTQFSSNYGAMFAGTILIIVPSIIIYMLLQEQVISGLAAGAIKG